MRNMYLKLKFWKAWQKYIMGIFKKHVRQNFLIGKTRLDVSDIDYIESILIDSGFQPDYFAFSDYGQITSMRIMYLSDPYVGMIPTWRQVHIRVYNDHEITIHDEISYEEDIDKHLKGYTLRMPKPEIVSKIIKILDIINPE